MSGKWDGRGHQGRLGKTGWERQAENRRTLAAHHGICHVCHQPGADRVDHVIPLAQGGADTEANRRPIHERPCHLDKIRAEAAAGQAKRSRKRPAEPHPGLRP